MKRLEDNVESLQQQARQARAAIRAERRRDIEEEEEERKKRLAQEVLDQIRADRAVRKAREQAEAEARQKREQAEEEARRKREAAEVASAERMAKQIQQAVSSALNDAFRQQAGANRGQAVDPTLIGREISNSVNTIRRGVA